MMLLEDVPYCLGALTQTCPQERLEEVLTAMVDVNKYDPWFDKLVSFKQILLLLSKIQSDIIFWRPSKKYTVLYIDFDVIVMLLPNTTGIG